MRMPRQNHSAGCCFWAESMPLVGGSATDVTYMHPVQQLGILHEFFLVCFATYHVLLVVVGDVMSAFP